MKLAHRIFHQAATLWPAAVLLAAALFPSPSYAQEATVVLASGPEGGLYHHLSQNIQRRLQGEIMVRIVSKPDCAESLSWLEEETDEIRFAFAQQDLAGERFRTSPKTPIRVVDRIAFDYLHIFVRESLPADSVTDLAARRIWAGEEGSATRFTVNHLLDSLGSRLENPVTYQADSKMSWEPGDLRAEDYAVRELPHWFQAGRLDAALLVAPAGSPEVCSLMLQARCTLTSLNRQTRRRLLTGDRVRDPFLRHIAFGDLPPGTYVNQGSSITTIAIPVVLMINRRAEPSVVTMVRDAALAEWQALVTESKGRQGCRMAAARPAAAPLADSPLKLHPHIDRPDDQSMPLATKCAYGVAAFLLAGIAIYAARRPLMRWIRLIVRTMPGPGEIGLLHLMGMLAGVLAVSMLAITFLIFWAEHTTNDDFSSFWESWWSITLYIFSGLENRAPYTAVGRFLGASGLALSWFLSVIGTGASQRSLHGRMRRCRSLRITICC